MNITFPGINLTSDDPVRTFAFYKKLGFCALEECEPDDKWYGATFALCEEENVPVIWIWRRQQGDDSVTQTLFVFNATNGLDKLYAQFVDAGIACDPPQTATWGGRKMMLTDPDGNQLLFL